MGERLRRDFLKASGVGLGLLWRPRQGPSARSCRSPATGRSCRDAASRGNALRATRRPAGPPPADHLTKRGEEERDGYVLESWVLDLNGLELVPAFLARPKARARRRRSSSTLARRRYDIGKKEFVEGRSYMQPTPTRRRSPTRATSPCASTLVLRRAEPHDRARHLQGDALAGPRPLGNDGLRLNPRPRLAADARRRGRLPHRDPRHVDGELDGPVAGRPRRAVKVTVDICCLTSTTRSSRRRG